MSNAQTLEGNDRFLHALDQERVVRAAAYAVERERIAEFEVLPLTLPHWTKLRLVNSPLLPPFSQTSDVQLAQFLWIIAPEFCSGRAANAVRRREKFLKRCRFFITPPPPLLFRQRWERRAARALAARCSVLFAAREYMNEAFQDNRRSEGGAATIEYYGDETAITARIGRALGWSEESILKMPLKRIFPHLKEIHERESLEHGVRPLLDNPSEDVIDDMLAAANRKN